MFDLKGSQFRIARYSPTENSFTGDLNNLFANIHLNNNKSQSSFVTDATGYIVAVLNPKSGNEFLTSTFYDIQLEEGSSATTYEPLLCSFRSDTVIVYCVLGFNFTRYCNEQVNLLVTLT